MKTLADHLSQYAAYHRDARNIVTHFFGIPMIVLATAVLLSRPAFAVGGLNLSPAVAVSVAFSAFYLSLDLALGLLMGLLMALAAWFGHWGAGLATQTWLLIGVGGFVVGWIIQFIGHIWEGRKPAFVDDIIGLVIGPLFVVAEALFLFGALGELKAEIERSAGPVRWGADSGARQA